MKWISVEDQLPETWDSYSFSGKEITCSDVVITNKGAAGYCNGCWVVADWDLSEAYKVLKGVTHWMSIPEMEEEK